MSCFSNEFVAEVANEFGLNQQKLSKALLIAEDEHSRELFSEGGRQLHRECAVKFRKLRKLLNRAVDEIENFAEDEIKELHFFQYIGYRDNGLAVPEPVEDLLNYLNDLFLQFEGFYNDGSGRPPSKSRDAEPLVLSALEDFACILRGFWCKETGTRFGQQFEQVFTDADADPDRGVLEPRSNAAKFLMKCAKQVDSRYEARHCKTVMRKLNEGSQVGFRKSIKN